MSNSDTVSEISMHVDLEALAWVHTEIEQVLKQTQITLSSRLHLLSGDSQSAIAGVGQPALQALQENLLQSAKALELVNMPAAAQMLSAISQAVQHFLARPEDFTATTVEQVNRACFALLEFLQWLIKGKAVDSVGLFPQYRDVAAISKLNVQPADLWRFDWEWQNVTLPANNITENDRASALARLDQIMLTLLRGKLSAAEDFRTIALGLADAPKDENWGQFWALVAGFFDGLATQAIPLDLFTKRAVSQILNIHKAYVQGEPDVFDAFAKNLLFFCANCVPVAADAVAPSHGILDAVRSAYHLDKVEYIDYNIPRYGRVDPALIKQAQKHIVAAKSAWSALCSGEPIAPQVVIDTFTHVSQSLQGIIPESAQFSQTLLKVASDNAARKQAPSPELALEVATAVLYVEGVFSNFDLNNAQLKPRFHRLIERILLVVKGSKPLPVDAWIEDLYRHVNDRETMGSVVGELRAQLSTAEQGIDSFLRQKEGGAQALAQAGLDLRQMYGVLSVLGLDEAARAILTMCEQINWLSKKGAETSSEIETQREQLIQSMSNSLGTLGFLVDMLAYQPLVARKMFVYDSKQQELKLLIGRGTTTRSDDQREDVGSADTPSALGDADQTEDSDSSHSDWGDLEVEQPALVPEEIPGAAIFDKLPDLSLEGNSHAATEPQVNEGMPSTTLIMDSPEDDGFGDDLREVFLEEAHDVIANVRDELKTLKQDPANRDALSAVRRGFHTLKGSSRMVGLMSFGSAAWACEQCFNGWLAGNAPVSPQLLDFTQWALKQLESWAKSLQQGQDGKWTVDVFEHKAQEAQFTPPPEQADEVAEPTVVEPAPETPSSPSIAAETTVDTAFVLDLDKDADKRAAAAYPSSHKESKPASVAVYSSWASENWTPSKSMDLEGTTIHMSYVDPQKKPAIKVQAATPTAKQSLFPPTEWLIDAKQGNPVEEKAKPKLQEPAFAITTPNIPFQDEEDIDTVIGEIHTDAEVQSAASVQDELDVSLEPVDHTQEAPLLEPEATLPAVEVVAPQPENTIKVIGSLEVSEPLYNVYIEEAQIRVEQLKNDLAQWYANGDTQFLEDAQIRAHSLAGSSATVGFTDLAGFAKNLEHGIEHYRQTALQSGVPADRSATQLWGAVCDEIARLLKQFTQGQLDTPEPALVEQLLAFKQTDFTVSEESASIDYTDTDYLGGIDFAEPGHLNDAALTQTDQPEEVDIIEAGELDDMALQSLDSDDVVDLDDADALAEALTTEDEQATFAEDEVEVEDSEPQEALFEQSRQELTSELAQNFESEEVIDAQVEDPEGEPVVEQAAQVAPQVQPKASIATPKHAYPDRNVLISEIFEIFEDEARDLLPRIAEGLRQWFVAPAQDQEALFEVLRVLHTFKGSARLAGAMHLGDMAHELETALQDATSQEEVSLQQEHHIFDQFDLIEQEFESLCNARAEMFGIPTHSNTTVPDVKPTPSSSGSMPAPQNAHEDAEVSEEPALAVHRLDPADQKAPFNELFSLFKEESSELLQTIQMQLRNWMVAPQQTSLTEALRALHTLKGSARMTGVMSLGSLVHGLESALAGLNERTPSAAEMTDVQNRLSRIEDALDLLNHAEQEVQSGLIGVPAQSLPEANVSTGKEEKHEQAQGSLLMNLEAADRDVVGSEVFASFSQEANRLVPQISAKISEWIAHPDSFLRLVEALRLLNTLQDNIKLSGIKRLGILARNLDHLLKDLVAANPTNEQLHLVNDICRQLEAELALLCGAAAQLQQQFQEAADKAAQVELSIAQALLAQEEAAREQEEALLKAGLTQHLDEAGEPSAIKPRTIKPTIARPLAAAASGQLIRVRATLIDELVTRAGEVNMLRSQLAGEVRQLKDVLSNELTTNLERLQMQLRDIELQSETQMASRMDAARAEGQQFDPLEFDRYTRVQELTRIMAESVNDVGTVQKALLNTSTAIEDGLAAQARSARDLQYTLLRARMVDFSSIGERFHRIVRLASKECEKQTNLTIEGGDIEIDRAVLDHIAPAFEHILRNCVVHGIESANERKQQGKPAAGQITIKLAQEGNDVSIIIRDDGSGLDLQKIRQKAQNMGLIMADSPMSDHDLAQMIYRSGLTTTDKVTELAGRGVGLDMAHAGIVGLGGRIEVFTQALKGAEFKMVLPLTTAVTQVAMVHVAGKNFGIPVNLIESIQRFSHGAITEAVHSGKIVHLDEEIPAFWLAGLLDIPSPAFQLGERNLQWLILRSAGQRVAIAVDHVIGSQEVVIKNVGPQFAHLTGFSGLTVLSGGRIVLMYNPVALARVFAEKGQLSTIIQLPVDASVDSTATQTLVAHHAPAASEMPRSNKIMVVDDSLTVRRVTQRLLERAGFEVVLAKDGQDALDQITQEIPALLLSDIEMPKMDGFELVRRLRTKPEMADLPIIMITSRLAQKHNDYARELGVNHYLGKPYVEDELLKLVGSYVQRGDASRH